MSSLNPPRKRTVMFNGKDCGDSAPNYVQFGCGLCAPARWINFDASPTLQAERLPLVGRLIRPQPLFPKNVRFGDVTVRLPLTEQSCAGVYSSHVLEHLALEDFRRALREVFRILMPGGLFRSVLPDLRSEAAHYLASDSPQAATDFMERTSLGVRRRPKSLQDRARAIFGNSGHLWMWDFPSISEELRRAGFAEIRFAHFGDSRDAMFADVEEEARWKGCLGFECQRPYGDTA